MTKLYDYINILIMPTDICNLNCIYCFHNEYHEKQGKMDFNTLKRLYDIVMNSYKRVNIIWHGGEPLVMGLDFFKEAISMQKTYKNCIIKNKVQTNLTLLTKEYSDFFVKERIGVGSSYDGILNESLRGKSIEIIEGQKRLLEDGIKCGFIMVVSKKNIDTLCESYNFFNRTNVNFTINIYVEALKGKKSEFELEPQYTAEKIIELYNLWKNDINCRIHIDYFERILNFIISGKKSVCKYTSCLGKWIGVRYNGQIVPCNRYFPEKYCYGNVFDYNNIREAFESQGFINLITESIQRREKCKECDSFELCSGGCNNVALNENGIDNNGGINCSILQQIYQYIKSDFDVSLGIDYINSKVANPKIKNILKINERHNANHNDCHYDSYLN